MKDSQTDSRIRLADVFPSLHLAVRAGFADDIVDPELGVSEVHDSSRRATIEKAIATALSRVEEQSPIASRFPGLKAHLDDPLTEAELGARAFNVLRRSGLVTWRDLAAKRPSEILTYVNFGVTSLISVFEASVRRSISALASGAVVMSAGPLSGEGRGQSLEHARSDEFFSVGVDSPLEHVRSALTEIGAWASSDRNVATLGDLVQLNPAQEPLPSRLGELWASVASTPLDDVAHGREIGPIIEALFEELDQRSRDILERRVFAMSSRATLEELGETLELTRERVRQLETGIIRDLRATLATPQFAPIQDRADELRRRVGTAMPVTSRQFIAARRWATRDVGRKYKSHSLGLLLWLAGPYEEKDDWIGVRAGGPDAKGNDLRAVADSSGFLSDDTLTSVLAGLGLDRDMQVAWLERIGGFRRVEGGWLDSSGSIIDQSLRYLAFRGVPMTVEEILGGIDRLDASARGIKQRLFDDPRAVRVSKTDIGLREWGHDEYTSLADEMVEEIERSGGKLPLDLLVERLVDSFGVSAASVRMYAGRPLFLVEGGDIRLRPEDQPFEVRDDLMRVAGCYELSPTTAAWRVPVDRDVLRGSGRHIPEQLAGWLRLRPGSTLTLDHPRRPVPLAWRAWAQPDIGSLKAFAEEAGASVGDWLVLVFDRAGEVDVRLVDAEVPHGQALVQLAQLMGLHATGQQPEALLTHIGSILGLDTSDSDSLRFRIKGSLEARRDVDLLVLAEEALFG